MKTKTVLTVGVWDLFHQGHLDFLNGIKKKYPGCKLIVGVLSDRSVKIKKGRNRPIIGEKERLTIVQNIKAVDEAFLCKFFKNKEDSIQYELNRLKPDVVEWGGKKFSGWSTTRIIGKIKKIS
ncbi:MAG TPA: adenylyltransferase/cytidyltransferase family protein [Candidatus Woesebacteria bacterium]|nr:adenylyltransferase/cytidyltransferase family protein [Candidatus Woesebacteria bacterium]